MTKQEENKKDGEKKNKLKQSEFKYKIGNDKKTPQMRAFDIERYLLCQGTN